MSSTRRILIVDDDPQVRNGITLALESDGYVALEAGDGETALQLLNSTPIDLLLLDIGLPGMSGLDLCRRIRNAGNNLPILILSGRTEEIDVVVGLEIGADDYVGKPFGPRELLARIAARLRAPLKSTPAEDGRLTFRDLVIDPNDRHVSKGGNTVHLTHTEFELLHFLAKNAGTALSRDKILEAIWGSDPETETRVIDVHVRNLRRKIEDDASHPTYILAVPGIGYRFTQAR